MPHGPLPPVPIMMCPAEVAVDLIQSGEALDSRNPAGEFSAGDWMTGLLLFTGATANAITITGGIDGLRAYASRLHRWNTEQPDEQDESGQPRQRMLRYECEAGTAVLNLNKQPSLEALQLFVEAAYRALELDVPKRSK
jgi:hypothetical protein